MQTDTHGPLAALALSVALVLAACTGAPTQVLPQAPLPARLATPDWRDEVIYFAMTDRFDDGDPRNNDQGADEFDPADGRKYSGGDLAGVTRRLDYIQQLGATALWLTPPVANQWWDGQVNYGGYHGYWAEDFSRIDAHVGTLAEYRALADALHGRGMLVVQDVVLNHVGNFFGYGDGVHAADPARGVAFNADARPHAAPTQMPFSLNDPRRADDRAAAIYHWTPNIADFTSTEQEHDWQLAGLDDLNTENPVVQRALRKSYGDWITNIGVDAFRVDTAFYVPAQFFDDFLHADDAQAPGVLRVAQATGRQAFHVFGEGFRLDRPFEDTQARKIDSYMRAPDGTALLPGMLNFPLYGSTLDVFARGKPPAVLAHRIRSMMAVHAQPHLMPSFVDNHDVDRFLAGGSEAALKQSLLLMLTLPGIPVIYAGTEQGFTEARASMFAAGFGGGGRDHFDTDAPLYRYLQQAITLRRTHRVFSRGVPAVIDSNAAEAGALAFTMRDGDTEALVVFNTADHETLLADVDIGLGGAMAFAPVFSIDGVMRPLASDAAGRITLRLPARSGAVWLLGDRVAETSPTAARPSVDALGDAVVHGDLQLSGTGTTPLRIVVDGDLAQAADVRPDANGRWRVAIDTASFVDPAIEHRVVAWSPDTNAVSAPRAFRVERAWQTQVDVDDPADDDAGPGGRYTYPLDAAWRARPLDVRRVRVATSGGSLRIELQLRNLLWLWNAPNGFDHLALTAFLQLPGRDDGATVMPLQNATLPDGMRWHLRLRAGGWTNALFASTDASAMREGTPMSPAADVCIDRDAGTVTLTLPASVLGRPRDLSGAKLYITTWDYDGRYRSLQPAAGAQDFGGGDGTREALVMDDTAVLVLP